MPIIPALLIRYQLIAVGTWRCYEWVVYRQSGLVYFSAWLCSLMSRASSKFCSDTHSFFVFFNLFMFWIYIDVDIPCFSRSCSCSSFSNMWESVLFSFVSATCGYRYRATVGDRRPALMGRSLWTIGPKCSGQKYLGKCLFYVLHDRHLVLELLAVWLRILLKVACWK